MSKIARIVLGLLAGTLVLGIAAYAYQTSRYAHAFSATNDGETLEVVLKRFGSPSIREVTEESFKRYATTPCQAPCVQRLWWEDPVLRGIEAWSVEFDSGGRVIHKYHWVSP